MCCLISAILLIGPRVAFIFYWFLPRTKEQARGAFDNQWVLPLLGWLFLPWTALVWAIFAPVEGFEWALLVVAFLADIGAYGGGYRSRKRKRDEE
jgi:CDP-diglyceride synthetase